MSKPLVPRRVCRRRRSTCETGRSFIPSGVRLPKKRERLVRKLPKKLKRLVRKLARKQDDFSCCRTACPMLRGRLPRRCCPTRGYRLEVRQKCLGLRSRGFSITWQGSRPYFTMKAGIKVAAGCLAPSPKGSGEPNDAPAVRICRRGDGSAIYAVGRGVSPSRMVGWSPRDRRSGGSRLSRPFGEAALMPLHLVRPARRAGRRLTGNAAILAAYQPPTTHPPTNQLTHQPTNQLTNKPTTRFPACRRFDM